MGVVLAGMIIMSITVTSCGSHVIQADHVIGCVNSSTIIYHVVHVGVTMSTKLKIDISLVTHSTTLSVVCVSHYNNLVN